MIASVASFALSSTRRSRASAARPLSTILLDSSSPPPNSYYDEYEILDIHDYLQKVEQELTPRPLRLNATHRKCMLRTLTGVQDVDDQVKTRRLQLQWQRATAFGQARLKGLKDMRIRVAPYFLEGLHYCDRPQEHFRTPAKWFSYMAKGRHYQGRFEWLLADIAPELIAEYYQVVDHIEEKYVKLSLMQDWDLEHKEAAIKCVGLDFPKQYHLSNGNSEGRRSEARLGSFLEQQANSQHEMIENVLVQPNATRGTGVIVSDVLNKGMTTEFDRMIVEREGDDHVRIHQVWEAKTCITPISLYDAISKKAPSLSALLADDSVRFILKDEKLKIRKEMPLLGLFAPSLQSPGPCAQRINIFSCQRLLSEDVNAVLEALETGVVTTTKEKIREELDILRRKLDLVNPVICIPREAALSIVS